jgi:Zn-dependent peptidase ImmA (M78 family)
VPRSAHAYVTPSALRWARESMGLTIEVAARKVGISAEKLARAERDEEHLTLRQAEAAARAYERPMAALFMREPPVEDPPERQFRRLPDAPLLPWPPEMLALARRVRARQDDATELYELVESTPPWTSLDLELSDRPLPTASAVRRALPNLEEQQSWRDRSGFRPLREWVDAVESLGVFVMQDGSMPVEVMRGFASTHPVAPAIVVNTNDDPRARVFTVLHELGHLLVPRALEEWCNLFAAELLMPRGDFLDSFGEPVLEVDLLVRVDELALSFGVTSLAAAVRLRRLDRISQSQMDDLRRQIDERAVGRVAPKGGNYYRTMVARLGPSYVQLVFQALDMQAVTFPGAAGLLGVKVNNFEKLRQTTFERVGIA